MWPSENGVGKLLGIETVTVVWVADFLPPWHICSTLLHDCGIWLSLTYTLVHMWSERGRPLSLSFPWKCLLSDSNLALWASVQSLKEGAALD